MQITYELQSRLEVGIRRHENRNVIFVSHGTGDEIDRELHIDALLMLSLLRPIPRIAKRPRRNPRFR